MKRRSFLKGLAAFALAPLAGLAAQSPAKVEAKPKPSTPMYDIPNSIEWNLDELREARYDIVRRAMQRAYEAQPMFLIN